MNSKISLLRSIIFTTFLPFVCLSLETDTLSSSLVIKDPDTIVSQNHVFKLGFFTPPNTTNRYLAIFYAFSEDSTIWIANRDNPLNDSSSTATISKDGNLVLISRRNQTVWSTSLATTSPINTTLQILDTGNLVLRDTLTGTTLWESFSHPSDVFVPNMKISHNIITGKKVFLSSWKNATDPGVGSFTYELEALPLNAPQLVIKNNGRPRWRSGPWNRRIFIGLRDMYFPFLGVPSELTNDSAGNFFFTAPKWNFSRKTVLSSSGSSGLMVWDDQKRSWITARLSPDTECDVYGRCGQFGSCSTKDSPICSCLKGFEPRMKEEWERGNWSGGCQRKNQLQCGSGGSGDGFFKVQFTKVPDFFELLYSSQVDECRSRCLGNCSCIAYAHDATIGCMLWNDTLIDVQRFDGVGVDLYIRLPPSELDNHKNKRLYIVIPVVLVTFACMLILIYFAWSWRVKRKGKTLSSDSTAIVRIDEEAEKVHIGEVPLFTFEMLTLATDRFNENNLLGRGGFGPVYKGNLTNGKEIAVKRLSAASGQGMQEFMNEVVVISKLQHRNLVKLLGCCVEKEEKMLVYEYMPNKCLGTCLFDPTHPSGIVLNWMKRLRIIEGIGRGLLYLHRDSRLRIIHRDLKPGNVLLDEDWNPKISDFGMARIFGGNQDHEDTAIVVGTYGYMAPEYVLEGRFSEKSDVYSFGVLMLEIIKGEKNTNYYNEECSLSLLGYAWKLWNEVNGLGFVDERIASLSIQTEIDRCIQIALLCVQESPEDRPTIQTVVSMLSCEIVDLPAPEQPVFDDNWNGFTTGSTHPAVRNSINHLTDTQLEGR